MELTESKVDELEAVLKANPFNRWADILSDAFSIDYQIMEMIMSGFEELGQDKMKTILERINKGEKTENDLGDRKSTRLNSSHTDISRMPSSA